MEMVNNMAYAENLERIEEELRSYGFNTTSAKDKMAAGGAGFFINLTGTNLPQDELKSLLLRIRHLMYSWLHVLGIKKGYEVKTTDTGLQVRRKAAKRYKNVIQYSEMEFTPGGMMESIISGNEASTMPDQDAIESAARIDAALEMPEDNYDVPLPADSLPDVPLPDSLPTTKYNSVFDHIAKTEQKAKQEAERARAGSNLQEIDNGKEV